MAAWLFVEGFSRRLQRQQLVEAFRRFGLRAVHIIRPARLDSGPVAFIDMVTTTAASRAAEALHGAFVGQHRLRVMAITPGKRRQKVG